MIIALTFGTAALVAAVFAAFAQSQRSATLSLWIAGLAAGCLFLTLGAETLAILQWIVSTLIAISCFFFSVMFGEYEPSSPVTKASLLKADRKVIVRMVVCGVLGCVFAAVVFLGSRELGIGDLTQSTTTKGADLPAIGKTLIENHMMSLEVLGLTLFLILIGGGVVARPEEPETQNASKNQGGTPC